MFYNNTIQINTPAHDEASLLEQINSLKHVAGLNIGWNLFHSIVMNAHNGTTSQMRFRPEDRNSFTLGGWVQHYAKYQIAVDEDQIELIFNYLITYHSGIFQKVDTIYTLINSPRDMEMKFEFVVLKTLE